MATKMCPNCFFGEVFNFDKYDDEIDRLVDEQPSGYFALKELKRRYSDATLICKRCNGTGKIDE
ncbi:hypothetical protein [Bacillus seohaeanensis]|uniref:Uncharacterized protein n=1 Tax=Bacillus seohaeanensis TaxID=284580 RepID=A0ABW5RTK4_9BACI